MHISAANELRVCLWDRDGSLRTAPRAGELAGGVAYFQSSPHFAITEIATGTYRVTRRKPSGLSVDLKLPDGAGQASCLLFGLKLQPGDAARTADKFVELGFLQGFVPAQPGAGLDRRYVAQGLPFAMELVAYDAPGFGQVVGLMLSGLNRVAPSRQLTSAQPGFARDTIRAFAAWTLQTCVNHLLDAPTLRKALEDAGFVYGWPAGSRQSRHVYFLPDNSLSVTVGSGSCDIKTNYMGGREAAALTHETLTRAFPGGFRANTSGATGCARHIGTNRLQIIYVYSLKGGRGSGCLEDGTSLITFEIPG